MAGFSDLFEKLKGIIGASFQFSQGDGPIIRDDLSGRLLIRDSGDVALANLQAASPTLDDDVVTKAYHDANPPSGGLTVLRFAIGTSTVNSTALIPATAYVVECQTQITTAYDGTINIGDGTTADLIQDETDMKEDKVGVYQVEQDTAWPNGTAVTATITGATVGAGVVTVKYVIPNS